MRPSRSRGVLSRAVITVVLFALLFVGIPVGPPTVSGGWPDLGLGKLWSGLTAALAPEEATAALSGQQQASAPRPAAAQQDKKKPKRVRELPGKRTATAKVFKMSDGTFEAEVFTKPLHYQDANGNWRKINTAVREQAKDGYAFAADRNGFVSRFGKSTRNLARFELDGKRLALGLPGGERAMTPQIDGDTVTYADAIGDADLVYEVTPESLKEKIVLDAKPDDATFEFTMRMAGVIARERSDGAIAFFDKKNQHGPPAFVMPAPFMNDSSDDPKAPHGKSYSDAVTQSVEQQGANFTITLRADEQWLASDKREYPVVIDPTIKIEPTPTDGKDAQIWSDTPDTNFGSDYRLSVGKDAWGEARSMMKFNVSFVPDGANLTRADVRVYYDNDLYTGDYNVEIEARQITGGWREDFVTWNSRSAVTTGTAGRTTQVKQAGKANVWHEFDILNLAQSWVSGAEVNRGIALKSMNTSLGEGGAIYQAAEYAYNGEVENRPKMVIAYGRPSAHLHYPTTIHATGAELTWDPYVDPDPNNPDDDVVEYQVHRSVHQVFEPSASTLVAPVDADVTSFTDTTAEPTPADSTDPFGKAYYYMIAAKTRDGQVIPGSTQVSRLPKAGRVTQIFHGDAKTTTLSKGQPNNNLNSFSGKPWLSTGIKSSTYGTTRSIMDFTKLNSKIPAGAQIEKAEFGLWGFYSWNTGAQINVHKLNTEFNETEATWNNATATTTWSGGDYSTPALDHLDTVTNDPRWHWWDTTSAVQGWVNDPTSNHGLIARLANVDVEQRVLYLSDEAEEPQLRPNLVVTYTEKTTESTYYAPDTPSMRMIPGDEYTIPVTLTNTTNTTWTAADYALSYKWELPDGTDATTNGNQLETALPKDIPPLSTVTVQAKVKTPIQSSAGNKREQFVLNWDLRNTTAGTWLSGTEGIAPLAQNVTVEDPTSDQLGLEKFYSYSGTATGAGSNVLVNQYAGNTVWSYDAFSNPGKGLNTFLRMTYNSMDTSSTSMGYGWSMAASGLLRLGTSLDLHPRGQDYPTTITMPDGDGTSHVFELNKNGSTDPAQWTYDQPAGVHFHVQRSSGSDDSRRWVFTRPDRTKFYFDDEGWLTAIADRNGNEQTFTYTERKSNNQPRKFLAYVTDPAGRQSLTVDYYTKSDTNNPKIIDNVKSVTDISGRTLTFSYSDKGLLTQLVDGASSGQAKTFSFTYDATQGNKNVKLVQVTDPRGNATDLTYFTAPEDPRDKWKLKSISDRLADVTSFSYLDPDGSTGSQWQSTVTDAEGNASTYLMDGYGRPIETTNAKSEKTTLTWDADNNVVALTEANGETSKWRYDPKTGYPTSIQDAQAVKNATPATQLEYATGLNGYTADLIRKITPEGRTWEFAYNANGNLSTVTDPKGVATTDIAGDYQTSYTYNAAGQLLTSTDANGNTTTYGNYHPTGFPKTITDALGNTSTTVYDKRGQVTKVTDAKGHSTTVEYDTFGRPGKMVEPKDESAGEYITTPAPTYDANDNVVQSVAPNGATSTATYDAADQLTASTLPKDTVTGPERKMTYTYDKVGNLLSETQPLGTASTTTGDYVTKYRYDAIYQLLEVTNADGNKISYSYDNVGNLTKVVDPRKNKSTDTTDYTTKFSYDAAHRRTSTTDALGNVSTVDYDLDGNVVSSTDAAGVTTTYTLDQRAMVTKVTKPHKSGVDRTTKYVYDQAGNRTKVITPRGVETTGEANDFVHQTVYDELNRPVERWSPYDPADARYNTPDKTFFSYDAVGKLASVSAPPSEGQTVRNKTTYKYFDNGWVRSSQDPWDIVTRYDYNDLGQQQSRTLVSAGGTERAMSWTYYPDGKLRSRSDAGVPTGAHVAMVDNSDTGNVTTVGTWDTSKTGDGYQGYNYQTAPAGDGSSTFTWTPVIPADGTYEVMVKYPSGVSGAATDATYVVDYGGLLNDVTTVDQTSGGGTWVSLGSFSLDEGNSATIELSDNANGTVLADGVKLVRDTSNDPADTESKSFDYTYDLNGNLTSLTDASSGAEVDTYDMAYDGLNQLSKVVEKASGTVRNTTAYTYDANGNTLTRSHDSQDAEFVYDVRDLVKQVTNTRTGKSPKVTSYGYTARGQIASETKPNGNVVNYDYNLDGSVASQRETTSGGGLVAEHVLAYNANGHRVRDEATVQNADDPTAYLDHVYSYEFDPQDRLSSVTKRDASDSSIVSSESYTHDANANVIKQTINGTTTSFTYDRNRLVTGSSGGTSASYNYDPFGRLNTVTSGGEIIESYEYDGFDRTTEHAKINDSGTLETTTYQYDPLDRTTSKTKSGKTTSIDYLGLSNKVVSEEIDGALSRSYTYNAWGQRLSQVKFDSSAGTEETSYYGYNLHSDVETLTDSNGQAIGTYGYTAYGKDDETSFTGVDKPDPNNPDAEPYNVYRFNGKRWDPNSESYDMGFRDYSPGLNRFLTRDTYNGALADMGLGIDPWTGNRYAFTGGNPISRIEIDGHCWSWFQFACDAAESTGEAVGGFVAGFAEGAKETGEAAVKGAVACVSSPLTCMAGAASSVREAASDPMGTLTGALDSLAAPVAREMETEDDLAGALGHAVWGAASALLGGKGTTSLLPDGSSVWDFDWRQRGRVIEDQLGNNTPDNYPVVDRWDPDSGTVTSIKSLDTGAKTYQNQSKLKSKVKKYINQVAGFNGKDWAGYSIDRDDIEGRSLDLVVPKGGVSTDQWISLGSMIDYGRELGVTVNVIEMG